jgi:short-subunit dehydrogenase
MHESGVETIMNQRTKLAISAGGAVAGLAVRRLLQNRYSFEDKSVLITGGSRGLGLVVARLLAAEGAKLTLVARTEETLEVAERDILEMGGRVQTAAFDVRDRAQASAAVQSAVDKFGSIDVLINNAGVIQVGPYETMRVEDFENAMATHLWAPLYTMMAAIPHMRKQRGGRIVNVSSIGGKIAVPHLMPYCASKFALAGLSDGMRAELRKDSVIVTSVFPGLMRTGSHVNASFKGKAEREFAWFSLMAGLPIFSMDARRAARQIVEACRKGRAELVITTQARLAVAVQGIAPGLVARMNRLVCALLPSASPDSVAEAESRLGWESASPWSPSILTSLADEAIEQNNEYRAA